MRSIFEPYLKQLSDDFFVNDEVIMINGKPEVFRLVMQQEPPFSINDYRFGIVVDGTVKANINLVEKQITAGSIVFLGPGTIISPLDLSENLEIFGLVLSDHFTMPFPVGQLPSAFNGQVRDFQIPVSEADIAIARQIFATIWQAVHQSGYNHLLVSSLVAALMHHYDSLFRSYTDQMHAVWSREQTIFDRFLYLVNQHAATQHHIGFYAGKMCLTERYLGTVIRQASGITAKEWIDRAVIARIQVELRHTEKTVVQISEEMNFANPSFFSKYFKRLVGQSPLEYKNR